MKEKLYVVLHSDTEVEIHTIETLKERTPEYAKIAALRLNPQDAEELTVWEVILLPEYEHLYSLDTMYTKENLEAVVIQDFYVPALDLLQHMGTLTKLR